MVYLILGAVIYLKSESKYVTIIWWWFPYTILALLVWIGAIPFGCAVDKEFQVA
jgi:hypothetical protein